MRASDFQFDLPPELIAQHPAPERDASRLLVFHRDRLAWDHTLFSTLPDLLRPEDLLVLNDSKVIPARLFARKVETHGEVEMLLNQEIAINVWTALLRPAKRVRPGCRLRLMRRVGEFSTVEARIVDKGPNGQVRVEFDGTTDIANELDALGHIPLPPYIQRTRGSDDERDRDRYQTIYARHAGSVAAPTAGLHFTPRILSQLHERGIETVNVTLHVGLGTFAPIKEDDLDAHLMHEEVYEISEQAASALQKARLGGRRIIAVGTTSLRVLESVARTHDGGLVAGRGRTQLFLRPPTEFRVTSGLLTNFHLPQSTLLVLVCAFATPGAAHGIEHVLRAYREAVEQRYRFFSYGDAMLLVGEHSN